MHISFVEANTALYAKSSLSRHTQLNKYEALNAYDLGEGLILTENQHEKVIVGSKKIKIMPAWLWLLDTN